MTNGHVSNSISVSGISTIDYVQNRYITIEDHNADIAKVTEYIDDIFAEVEDIEEIPIISVDSKEEK